MWVRDSRLARLSTTLAFVALAQSWARAAALSKDSSVHIQAPAAPKSFSLELLRAFPHEGRPFTQGLEMYSDGKHLVETSGSYPPGTKSYVRIVDPTTGATVRSLEDGLQGRFVEGIAQLPNGNWFASTYTDKKAVEYDKDMNIVAEHSYPGTGWGLARTTDGGSFLATNGSEYVMTLQKGTFEVIDAKVVTCLGKRVKGLNELELVDNFMGLGPTLLGNVYLSRLVLAVNPATGQCVGVFDLDVDPAVSGVTEPLQSNENAGFHACNGLAWNKTSETLFATGKNWEQMFEVRVHPDEQGQALKILTRHLMNFPPADVPASQQALLFEVSSAGDHRLEAVARPHRANPLQRVR